MRALLLAAAVALSAEAVSAADVASAWVQQLNLDGYEEIEVSRTWLGRTRILAEKGDLLREIVLNTRTGELLRDYSRSRDGRLRLPLGFEVELDDDGEDEEDNSGSGSGNSGSGSNNSGSGSSNSGSGSSNSGSGSGDDDD